MLVAISGSQGSGKSTVLNKLKHLGCSVVERKTSRSILSDWGVSLEDINNDHKLTIAFQQEIIQRKYNDDIKAAESESVWFTERTPIDLLVYATISLGKENKYSDWLIQYGNSCIQLLKHYTHTFFLTSGQFDVEQDGIRGHNFFYSMMVDATMRRFYLEFLHSGGNFTEISIPSLDDRINIIKTKIDLYDKKKDNSTICI